MMSALGLILSSKDITRAGSPGCAQCRGTFADVVDEFLFQRDAGFPNFLVTDLINVFPQRRIALIFKEGLAKVLFVHGFPLAGAPGGIVHAVGDVADVAFVGIHVVDLLVFVVREELMLAIKIQRGR